MNNPENKIYPLPAHVELAKPPMKLRPGFEIAAARNIVRGDVIQIKEMADSNNLSNSWTEGLTHPNWSSPAKIIMVGFKANREISRRHGLSYALGATPDAYFSEMPLFIAQELENETVSVNQATRPIDEVKKAYEIISESIQNSLELQIAVETLRLFSIDLQKQGGEDFHKLSILFYIEDRLGKLEALDYVLGEKNVIVDILDENK
ncbi:hypothetical protein HYT32_01170 [Candidatus Roizmanbacteria bacterium]|nr:hypothetical protein [Candidatus Roizmanbacteria bacterium]